MFVEVIAAKVGIGAIVVEKVIDNDQDGMGHRYRRLLGASTSGKTPELRTQVGVLRSYSSMGGFDQSHAHPRISAPYTAALAFTRTLVVARTDACPGGQVSSTREAAHVNPDFSDQHLGNA